LGQKGCGEMKNWCAARHNGICILALIPIAESICFVVWLAKLEDNVIEVLEIHNKVHYS